MNQVVTSIPNIYVYAEELENNTLIICGKLICPIQSNTDICRYKASNFAR